MAYLVLARKWRPQNFPDLIGQEHVGQTLANAIRSGRIQYRQWPIQQDLETWNDFWSESKGA